MKGQRQIDHNEAHLLVALGPPLLPPWDHKRYECKCVMMMAAVPFTVKVIWLFFLWIA